VAGCPADSDARPHFGQERDGAKPKKAKTKDSPSCFWPETHETQGVGPILVIDDEPYILRSLRHLLEREGYQVETATSGEEGLRLADTVWPALVLLDVMLPGLNGFAVCEGIKHNARLHGCQVVMLSARGRPVDCELAERAGADGYMVKPFSPSDVLLCARRAMALPV
jgi:DNA-binding response OmpR family regulator